MKATKKNAVNGNMLAEDEQNIDKVRDILFGSKVRDFEHRFSQLEEQFNEKLAETKQETAKKLNELEELVNREVSSLTESITTEQHSRQNDLKELTSEVKDNCDNFDQKIASMEKENAKNDGEIRKEIRDQSKDLTSELKKRQKEILSKLDRESKELREEKADRNAIAELFTEMATRLKGDLKTPTGDK